MKYGKKLALWLLALLLCSACTAQAAFSDVSAGDWFYSCVTEMTDAGVLIGYPDGTFQPQQTVTGAEFVSITARQAGLTAAQGQTAHWAAGTMAAALQAGWYDWDELPPTGERFDRPIARQLAVKIVMKALLPEARGDYAAQAGKLSDLSALDGRYYDAVFAAYASGVATGDADGAFRPRDGLSRAEACALIARAAGKSTAHPAAPAPDPVPAPTQTVQGGVTENGALQVRGTQLVNAQGEPVLLHGMSTHGLQWYGNFASAGAMQTLAARGANLIRLAMYTEEGGYLSDPAQRRQQLYAAVDTAIANDLYVIIDWHILSDGNPMTHLSEAKAFFAEAAARYRDEPAVLYEICNEPNGGVSWARDIKPYAEQVAASIRGAGANGVILIGSGTWSQDLQEVAADPVAGQNLMATCHFYAGTHGAWLRDRIDSVLAQGLPVFVSEWGTSAADGNGGVYLTESAEWLDFLASRGISWANWSLCDKGESSAALRPGASPNGGWTAAELSESGSFVFSRF